MSPMNSWKSMGPLVVSALKLGAMEPRRRLCERELEVSTTTDQPYYTEVMELLTVQAVVQVKPFRLGFFLFFVSSKIRLSVGGGKVGQGRKRKCA